MFFNDEHFHVSALLNIAAITWLKRPRQDSEAQSGPDRENIEKFQLSLERILGQLRDVRVLLPSGATIVALPDFFRLLKDLRSFDVDLRVGTLGSGWVRDEIEKTIGPDRFHKVRQEVDPDLLRLELERRYGVFLGCHVFISLTEAERALRAEFSWYSGGSQPNDPDKAERALEMIDPDRPPSRPGRRKHGDGVIEPFVRFVYAKRIEGDLAGASNKVIVQDAIVSIEKITARQVKISQTTMKEYLAPLLKGRSSRRRKIVSASKDE